MDYKKIIIYIIVILVGVGIWFKRERDEKRQLADSERFAEVYAATTVMAELYRNEPQKFFAARDSILAAHGVDSAWVFDFRNKFEKNEEKWTGTWSRINAITDSLIAYYREHPIIHDTSSTADTMTNPPDSQ